MRLVAKTSHYERILAYLVDQNAEVSLLTENEQEMLTRWMEAFTLLRNYKSTSSAVAILLKRFPNISQATAYRDCAAAINLFGEMSKTKKEGIIHLTTEITKDAIAIARIKNNEDAMMRGALNIAKINGVNITDPDMPDFDKLQPHTYNISLPPAALNVILSMVKAGRVDLTDMVRQMQNVAEDAEIIEDEEHE